MIERAIGGCGVGEIALLFSRLFVKLPLLRVGGE